MSIRSSGRLTANSPRFGGDDARYECFVLEAKPGETWRLDLVSTDFPPDLLAGRGETCEDVSDQMLGSVGETGFPRLTFMAKTAGRYLIAASAARLDSQGAFTLTVTRMPAP